MDYKTFKTIMPTVVAIAATATTGCTAYENSSLYVGSSSSGLSYERGVTSIASNLDEPVTSDDRVKPMPAKPQEEHIVPTTEKERKLEVLFAYNSATRFVNATGTPLQLDEVKHRISDYVSNVNNVTVYVDGYASLDGNKELNKRLSQKRAITLASLLCEVNFTGNVEVRGFGETDQFGHRLSEYELNNIERLPLTELIGNAKLREDRMVVITDNNNSEQIYKITPASYSGACSKVMRDFLASKININNAAPVLATAKNSNVAKVDSVTSLHLPTEEELVPPDAMMQLAIADIENTIRRYEGALPHITNEIANLEARCSALGQPDRERPLLGVIRNNYGEISHHRFGKSKCEQDYGMVREVVLQTEMGLNTLSTRLEDIKKAVNAETTGPTTERINNLETRAENLVTITNTTVKRANEGMRKVPLSTDDYRNTYGKAVPSTRP